MTAPSTSSLGGSGPFIGPSLERKLIRWFHILASIPILGYVYGPVAAIPEAARAVKWVIFPLVILSGFWLWLGPKVKARWKRARTSKA